MKTRILLTVLALFTAIAGCGGTNPPAMQCNTNEDCTTGCEGYDKALCSADGICFCSNAIPTARCDRDEDCAEDCSAYDSHSCSGGICYCQDQADVQCVQDVDCAEGCAEADSFACKGGMCHCETIEVQPSCTDNADCAGKCDFGCTTTCTDNACVCTDCPDPDCPNITRGELVSLLYEFLELSGCPEDGTTSTCTDLPNDLLDCQWGKLEARVLGTTTDCRPDDPINRAGFIGIISNTLTSNNCWPYPPEEPSFSDIDPGDWYYHAVEMAVEFRFITPGGEFRPGDMATTCFVEDVLYRTPTTSILTVTVFPSEASYTINSLTVDTPHYEETFTGSMTGIAVPFGYYEVEFHDLPGYITPQSVQFLSLVCYPTAVSGIYLSVDSSFNMRAVPVADSTVVKGASGVPTMDVELEALEQGTVEKLSVRLNADTNSFSISAAGNLAGNTVVVSAMLYDGNDVIAGPEALVGVLDNGTPDQFDPDSGDYYKVVFTSLGYVVPAGTTKTFTLRVNLLNTMQERVYLRANILPCEQNGEVVVEDANGDAMIVNGETSNCHFLNGPIITVLTHGILDATSSASRDSTVFVAGSSGYYINEYHFRALHEGYLVTKLTIVNDLEDNFFVGDEITSTVAVAQVRITYTDINGVTQVRSASMSGGQITFSGLDFYVLAGGGADLEVSVDLNSMVTVGESLSGAMFRLGIINTGNDASTFEAIGSLSSESVYDPPVGMGSQIFVVRKTRPTFAKASGLSTTLINGENRLYGFTVMADNAGSVSFGRFPIWIDTTTTLRNFKFFRGATDITSEVNIFSVMADISDGSGNEFTGNVVMVSFNQEETVSSGASQTYYLDAEVLGSVTDDFIQTYLLGYDYDDLLALSNPCHNPNTGRIHDTDGSGIFDTEAGFSQAFTPMTTAVVWSDKSADIHAYPTVSGGVVMAGTGSCDWINGWGLGLEELSAHTLTY